jgi:uncharacterized LabA/DUF88 family protein
VQYLQVHSGIQVEVASFAKSASQRLIDACNDFMDLTLSPEKYLIGYRPRRTGKKKQKHHQSEKGNVIISRAVPKDGDK